MIPVMLGNSTGSLLKVIETEDPDMVEYLTSDDFASFAESQLIPEEEYLLEITRFSVGQQLPSRDFIITQARPALQDLIEAIETESSSVKEVAVFLVNIAAATDRASTCTSPECVAWKRIISQLAYRTVIGFHRGKLTYMYQVNLESRRVMDLLVSVEPDEPVVMMQGMPVAGANLGGLLHALPFIADLFAPVAREVGQAGGKAVHFIAKKGIEALKEVPHHAQKLAKHVGKKLAKKAEAKVDEVKRDVEKRAEKELNKGLNKLKKKAEDMLFSSTTVSPREEESLISEPRLIYGPLFKLFESILESLRFLEDEENDLKMISVLLDEYGRLARNFHSKLARPVPGFDPVRLESLLRDFNAHAQRRPSWPQPDNPPRECVQIARHIKAEIEKFLTVH